MNSSKFMSRSLLNLNNQKDNQDDLKIINKQNKKKSLEIADSRLLELQKQRNKKKSLEIPKQRNKKNSLEIFKPRNSKLSNKYELKRKKSIFSYNGIVYNNNGNSSFSGSEIDYKGIGEEIKYTILEMKNNLMELKDGLDIYKENSSSGEFDEGITSLEILKD